MFQLAPKTRDLLALFTEAEYGAEFTYEQILEESGCDLLGQDRSRTYSVVKILERDHRRTLLNLRGRGYKVAHPREHVESMGIRRRRAGKQIELAERTGKATNLEMLNQIELQTLADAQVWVSRVTQVLGHHDERLARIEQHLGMDEPPIDSDADEIGE